MFTLPVPPPALSSDSPHLAPALRHIALAPIPHSQRNILRAVALHATNTHFLRAIPLIPNPRDLDYLAGLFRRALLAFKNRGGRPAGSASDSPATPSTPVTNNTSPLTISTSIPTQSTATSSNNNPALIPEIQSLCTAFQLDPSFTLFPGNFTNPPARLILSSRPMGFAETIKFRSLADGSPHCIITGSTISLVGGHILPHSLVKTNTTPTASQISFWMFLAFFLGREVRDSLWRLLGEEEGVGTGCTNGLCLGEGMHKFFDSGIVTLEPMQDNQVDDGRSMKVIWHWHHRAAELSLARTLLPRINLPDTEDQAYAPLAGILGGESTPLRNGDIFIIQTSDPERHPLPVKGFLQLHDLLWRTLGAAGLLSDPDSPGAGNSKHPGQKRKRFQQAAEAPTTTSTPLAYPTPSQSSTPAHEPLKPQVPPTTSHGAQQRSVSGSSTQSSTGSSTSSIFDDLSRAHEDCKRGDDEPYRSTWSRRQRSLSQRRVPSSSPPPTAQHIAVDTDNLEDTQGQDVEDLKIPRKRECRESARVPPAVVDENEHRGQFEAEHFSPDHPCLTDTYPSTPAHNMSNTPAATLMPGYNVEDDTESKLDRTIQFFMAFWHTAAWSQAHDPLPEITGEDIGYSGRAEPAWDGEEEWEYETESDNDCDGEVLDAFDRGLMALVAGL